MNRKKSAYMTSFVPGTKFYIYRVKLGKKAEIGFNCVIIKSKEEVLVLKVGDFNDW